MQTNLLGTYVIAFNDAALRFVDPESGEVVGEIDLTPGPQPLDGYAPLGVYYDVTVHNVFQVRTPKGRLSLTENPERYKSAASLTYTPSLAEEQEALMRQMVSKILKEQRSKEDRREQANRSKPKAKPDEKPSECLLDGEPPADLPPVVEETDDEGGDDA